jgi:hypothetical protein
VFDGDGGRHQGLIAGIRELFERWDKSGDNSLKDGTRVETIVTPLVPSFKEVGLIAGIRDLFGGD